MKKFLPVFISVMIFLMYGTGCTTNKPEGRVTEKNIENEKKEPKPAIENKQNKMNINVKILNFKAEITEALKKLPADYEKETQELG
ncbi:MAG: hypothetical protein N3I35_11050 [Clostridia bacterium]|nr:hypothetical protein [Clostridia bacterium]